MSHKTVRTHTHVSNRAKPEKNADRKVVFKSVLDSPFRIQWPSVPVNIQNSLLALAIGMLDGVADYHSERSRGSRKRKYVQRLESKRNKRRKVENAKSQVPVAGEAVSKGSLETTPEINVQEPPLSVEAPTILEHIIVGINEVTRRLEAQIRLERLIIDTPTMDKPTTAPPPPLRTILVCCGDIDPPLLVDHLPHLVAAYNSSRPANVIKIVPLPKGAEVSLAQATGLRRAAVLAIDANFNMSSNFATLLETIPTLTAPWLSNTAHYRPLIPTHIKQLRTSAPKDMKAAKQSRIKEKSAAKQRRKPQPVPS